MPKTEMLVNYVPGEECRIAIVEDGRLEELYQERASTESHVGNIYKGKVVNVEPSIQAAFIDFGLERNGFLHISDLHPMHFAGDAREGVERVGSKRPRHERPPIQKCLRRGQDLLVQVLKEGIGTKGPTLTGYLSIPGRFIVMMPHMERLGVSRKIEDEDTRKQMRKMLDELNPPKRFGFIIRTAGLDRPKNDLKRDLAYLQRLWKVIEHRMNNTTVGELYTESDLIIRTIRDVFSNEIQRIVVDDPTAAKRARDFLAIANPRSTSKVAVYSDPVPLFHRFDIERQIENINARCVPLPSGGSLVIDTTEALVAIDVNSGKSRTARDAETNAFKTNLEATDEICRQLRLRDLGGVIVNDLIDMRQHKHRREVEQRFRQNLKKDRARTRISQISQFGILEMTRQRMRPSLQKSIYTDCPNCLGAGQVRSCESVVLDVMRRLALMMHRSQVTRVELTVSPTVAFQLLNRKRGQLVAIERQYDKPVMVRVAETTTTDYVDLVAFDQRGGTVDTESLGPFDEPVFETVEALEELEHQRDTDASARDTKPRTRKKTPRDEKQDAGTATATTAAEAPESAAEKPKRTRRRRRGGRTRSQKADDTAATDGATVQATDSAAQATASGPQAADATEQAKASTGKRRRRRRGGRRAKRAAAKQANQAAVTEPATQGVSESAQS
ncbi:MAG: Rne/Rng family ribonuclease [Phycisphaeraceae bacterium]